MKEYIVCMPFCWGRAKTISEARKFALKNRPSFARKGSELVYEVKAGNEYTIEEDGRVIGEGARQIGRK